MLAAFDRVKRSFAGANDLMQPASLSKHATAVQSCAVQKKRTHFDRKTPANFRKSPAKTRKLPQIRKSRSFDDQGIPWCSLARWQVLRGVFTLYGQCTTGNDANSYVFLPKL